MKTPAPAVVRIALRPKSEADRERLHKALAELTAEDSSFSADTDPSGQIVLNGMGELHLESKLDILKRTYKVDANVGAPQIAYRETISRPVIVDHTHKGQTGASGQFAHVKLEAAPNEPGAGNVFEPRIGGAVPEEYISGVERGLESVLCSGVLAGFPVIDLKVQLVDGAYHELDSSALAFEIAARAALRDALQKGGAVLLEPIMKIEVTTPPEYVEAIIHDLKPRQATITDASDAIVAFVPLVNLLGYMNTLRSLTRGEATFTIAFDNYAPVPISIDDPPFRPAAAVR